MKSIYAELNGQNELKRTYCRRYKNLQAAVATTTDTPVMIRTLSLLLVVGQFLLKLQNYSHWTTKENT